MRRSMLLIGLMLAAGCADRAATTGGDAGAVTPAAAPAASDVPLHTAERVDLNRYLGRWYEIAALPASGEAECVGGTTADYSRAADGNFRVVNQCRTADGSVKQADGVARIANPATNAKLEISYAEVLGAPVWPIAGDYWILAVDPQYRWAVVGEPSRDHGWILSRSPRLATATLRDLAARMDAEGYDPCRLTTTPQAGGLSERRPLCEVVQTRRR